MPPVATTKAHTEKTCIGRANFKIGRVVHRLHMSIQKDLHSAPRHSFSEQRYDVACRSIAEKLTQCFLVIRNFVFATIAIKSCGVYRARADLQKCGLTEMKFSGRQWMLVKLQRPPPEMRIFFPNPSAVPARPRACRVYQPQWRTSSRPRRHRERGHQKRGSLWRLARRELRNYALIPCPREHGWILGPMPQGKLSEIVGFHQDDQQDGVY